MKAWAKDRLLTGKPLSLDEGISFLQDIGMRPCVPSALDEEEKENQAVAAAAVVQVDDIVSSSSSSSSVPPTTTQPKAFLVPCRDAPADFQPDQEWAVSRKEGYEQIDPYQLSIIIISPTLCMYMYISYHPSVLAGSSKRSAMCRSWRISGCSSFICCTSYLDHHQDQQQQ